MEYNAVQFDQDFRFLREMKEMLIDQLIIMNENRDDPTYLDEELQTGIHTETDDGRDVRIVLPAGFSKIWNHFQQCRKMGLKAKRNEGIIINGRGNGVEIGEVANGSCNSVNNDEQKRGEAAQNGVFAQNQDGDLDGRNQRGSKLANPNEFSAENGQSNAARSCNDVGGRTNKGEKHSQTENGCEELAQTSISFVGFIGTRRQAVTSSASIVEEIWKMDNVLVRDLQSVDGMLAYVTGERVKGGDYGNLVLFRDRGVVRDLLRTVNHGAAAR
jgi:hypothetical protein